MRELIIQYEAHGLLLVQVECLLMALLELRQELILAQMILLIQRVLTIFDLLVLMDIE
jgi:hypothetical protein